MTVRCTLAGEWAGGRTGGGRLVGRSVGPRDSKAGLFVREFRAWNIGKRREFEYKRRGDSLPVVGR